eukprot:TRINITY_DN12185_c0_g1_i3.p1 TRINITY_DN12185_c0_g1~~TRINITY_DN12185_c0_g1_i3.p1  ORF type:complete len:111 (+),score=20.26 TRINITY_DN12185_c0_g1_i3:200-532(+)
MDNSAAREALAAMGFEDDQVHAALQRAATVEEAIALILGGDLEPDPSTNPTAGMMAGMKMVLCCNQDLNMSAGKLGAQCAHAALGCVRLRVRFGSGSGLGLGVGLRLGIG